MNEKHDSTADVRLERVVSLRPCPFCGCSTFDTLAESGIYMNRDGYAVARCGRPECAAEIIGPTVAFVRDAWNRRADDERVKMLIEAARDLLGAVDADSRVKRGDYYHARKSVRVALASFEQANA